MTDVVSDQWQVRREFRSMGDMDKLVLFSALSTFFPLPPTFVDEDFCRKHAQGKIVMKNNEIPAKIM